jgi:hypothetical protein
MKFSRIVKQIKRENEQLAEANQILIEAESQQPGAMTAKSKAILQEIIEGTFETKIEEYFEQNN